MNWSQLITDLQNHGFTQPQIAARVGCGQTTVSELLRGNTTEPRYSLGQALIQLHRVTVPAKKPARQPAATA